ncbi:hypothetical protein Pmani_025899 [Petrolisthes manimaculis]|uniref:Ig-like domain-containing protein n=1 Tax=Petrolisthes manimaculis TaxID=1843537 RepID=A0AAE1TYE7_9EUCA|nr:hypothetical protein Pmani_025899 [Petrolisthes manimaculis]
MVVVVMLLLLLGCVCSSAGQQQQQQQQQQGITTRDGGKGEWRWGNNNNNNNNDGEEQLEQEEEQEEEDEDEEEEEDGGEGVDRDGEGTTNLQPFDPWVQVQRFVVPRYVAVGTNMSLECDYVVQRHATLYSLKWYKGSSQFYQYIPSKTHQPHAVFSVPGLRLHQLVGGVEGRVLRVVGVGLAASDIYRCELVAEGPPFHTTQRSANMTVAVLPRSGPIVSGVVGQYRVNQWIDLNCTIPSATPPLTLTWTINGRKVSSTKDHFITPIEHTHTSTGLEHTHQPSSTLPSSGLESTTTSRLSLKVEQHHFQGGVLTVTCEAKLGSIYSRSHKVTFSDTSARWFSSFNLYRISGAGKAATPPSAITTMAQILLFLLHHLLQQ